MVRRFEPSVCNVSKGVKVKFVPSTQCCWWYYSNVIIDALVVSGDISTVQVLHVKLMMWAWLHSSSTPRRQTQDVGGVSWTLSTCQTMILVQVQSYTHTLSLSLSLSLVLLHLHVLDIHVHVHTCTVIHGL